MTPPRLAPAFALLSVLLALSALLGWAFDIAVLKHGLASSVAMNPATAVCLALLGLEAVRMSVSNANAVLAKGGQLAVLVVIVAGLGKLSDVIFGTTFAIDQTLFSTSLDAERRFPSRMAPNTATCLVLLGVAMLFMRGGADARVRNSQLLAVLALLVGLLALVGNLFDTSELSGLAQYIPMAFNTAIAVCCVAASILSCSARKGLLKLVRWQSLKIRMTLASMAIFVTGVWSLTYLSNVQLRADFQRQLGAQQFATVSLLAGEMEHEVLDRFRALETIAAELTPAVLGNTTTLQQLLENRPIFTGLFSGGVFVTRLDGISFAAMPLEARRLGVDYAARDFLVAALKEGRRAVGRPDLDSVHKVVTFEMAVPIRTPAGETIGALVGATDLAKTLFLTRIAGSRYGNSGDYLLVATKHRLIFSGSDKKRLMTTLPAPGSNPTLDHYIQGGEGTSVFVNPLGVEILASTKHIQSAGWALAAILPVKEAFAPIRALNQRYLLSALLFTLLAGMLTLLLTQHQLAPLLSSVHSLAALKHSDQPLLPLPVARRDEIGELIGAFNGLLASLAQRNADLAESRARYERAINGTNDGIWEWMPATGEGYFSPRWKHLLGYEDHELPNAQETFFDRIHPEDKARVQQAIRAHLEERRPYSVELRMRCKSGEYRWFSSRGQAEWDNQGQPRRMAGALSDISERKQAEALLQETAARRAAEQSAALEAQRQSRLSALNLLEDARAARAQAEAMAATLAERNELLSRFNKVAVGRELDMIDLKRQINALARELGRDEPFDLAFADAPPAAGNEATASRPSAAAEQR
jgi:PAS domain S-box-containing protein